MKKAITSLLLLILFFLFSFPSLAQDNKESTDSADVEKEDKVDVEEKINLARSDPTSFIGTVTDIAEGTIQIKGAEGDIQQVSADEEKTKFVSVGKKTTEVSFSDVAIGDFIVSMGFQNGNSVLDAVRVLITSPVEPVTRKIIIGTIDNIEKKTITLNTNEDQFEIVFGKTWKGPEIPDLEIGNELIAVVDFDDNILNVRTIQFVKRENKENDESEPSDDTTQQPTTNQERKE